MNDPRARSRIGAVLAMPKFTIELPDDVCEALHMTPTEVAYDVRLAAAIDWFQRGQLSHGRAAEIAGVSRAQFIDELAARKIDVIDVDFEEIQRELRGG
jgi:predicted HTH domain antitoxin